MTVTAAERDQVLKTAHNKQSECGAHVCEQASIFVIVGVSAAVLLRRKYGVQGDEVNLPAPVQIS